jgi:mannosyltransferase OCH1-like enzyme
MNIKTTNIYRIPLLLHQTYISDKLKKYKLNKESWIKSKWLTRKFYNNKDIEKFINKNTPLFLPFFKSLHRIKEKVLFFKYIVLYSQGGLYCDFDTVLFNENKLLKLLNNNIVFLVNDLNIQNKQINDISNNKYISNNNKYISTKIILSVKNHPLWYDLLIYIMRNYKITNSIDNNLGKNILTLFLKKYGKKYKIKYISNVSNIIK